MKRLFTFAIALSAAYAASAQTYRLGDMTLDEFKAGGTEVFSFEKYTYGSGYSKFQNCDEQSTANYVDIHQVEYVGGNIITEIEGVTAAGETTWASNRRTAWYDMYFDETPRTDSKNKFTYVCYDERPGYGLELNGNDEQTAAISFTAPADGYYKVTGKVVRQDINSGFGTLDLVPVFRQKADLDKRILSTLSFNYTSECGEWPEGDGHFRLADGGTRRYIAQQPTEFTFTFEAKEGDVITFEESTASSGRSSNWARDFQARTFLPQLDVTTITQEEAEAADNFLSPYVEFDESAFYARIDELQDQFNTFVAGEEYGQYPQEALDAFNQFLNSLYAALDNELVNALTVNEYYEKMEQAWQTLQTAQVKFILESEGNYILYKTVQETDESGNPVEKVAYDSEVMENNDDTPWGYYYHDLNSGQYIRFANHNASNKSGAVAWYKGGGDWLYLTDGGALHPTVTQAPAIMFTAPADGVYRVVYDIYRPNPNASVENPLYVRNYYLAADAQSVDKTNDIYSQEYGSVKNDGMGGKKPIKGSMYVYLKQGDRIITEVDCWTTNRNSSAGTQINAYYVLSHINNETPYTIDDAVRSGETFYNPYVAGDATALKEAVVAANNQIDVIGIANIGTEEGQYDAAVYDELKALLDEAATAISGAEQGDPTYDQILLNDLAIKINGKTSDLADARKPFEKFINGTFSIQLAGTNRYLTQKNSAGAHHYAGFLTNDIVWVDDVDSGEEGAMLPTYPSGSVGADAEKNGVSIEEYDWTFIFSQLEGVDGTQITNALGYLTSDAYVVEGENENPENHSFRFWTREKDDDVFAIQRLSDGLYWTDGFTWKSPYDKINTNAKPQYVFTLSQNTLTAIKGIDLSGEATVRATRYYSLDGKQLSQPQRGVVIRQQLLGNGTVCTNKVVIK